MEGDIEHVTHEDGEPIISIHALRVEGDPDSPPTFGGIFISIHALRVEGDHKDNPEKYQYDISIHALRVEGDRHICKRRLPCT